MRKLYLVVLFALVTGFSFAQTTYYSKSSATDFNSTASWGTNTDGTGTAPGSISNADNFIIQNSASLSLSGSASVRNITINAGSLTIGANTLTVAAPGVNTSIFAVTSGGTLTVTGGTLDVGGSVFFADGSALTQSGGLITVDPNAAAVVANSSALPVFGIGYSSTGGSSSISTAANGTKFNCTGGTIRVVDPTATTTSTNYAFAYRGTVNIAFGSGHTMEFGDGVSTTAGGYSGGFYIHPFVSTGYLSVGNLTVNSTSGSNRLASLAGTLGVLGTLTVISGGEFRYGSTLYAGGNIVNNGTITSSTSTLSFSTFTGGTSSTVTSPQTVSGTGTFRNSTSPTGLFYNLTINNSSSVSFASGTLNLGSYNGSISQTLTFTNGQLNTNNQTFIVGVSSTTAGSISYTSGGFSAGTTLGRWFSATGAGSTITAGAVPSSASGIFPFYVNGNSRNLWVHRPSASGGTAGVIRLQYNDGSGLNSISTVADGAYSINRQSAANWVVSTSNGFVQGTGTMSFAIAGEGIFTASNTNSRLMKVSSVVGTHQTGTVLPLVQRTGLTSANFTGTYYIGVSSADLPILTAQSGKWEEASTWEGGVVPGCSNYAAVSAGHTVTVDGTTATANVSNLTVTGTLVVSGGTLTVGCTDNNTPLTNGGVLTVSGGSLIVNGNISNLSGSTFNQSAGSITIDGNSGSAATSVATGTALLSFASNLMGITGGTITIVDPHAGTGTETAVSYTGSGSVNIGIGHTIQFGNGVSTTAGGSSSGFRITPGTKLAFGNVIVNTLASANGALTQSSQFGILGNLTITNGEVQSASTLYLNGNLVNNGTFTSTSTVAFANFASNTQTASTNAQTVSGTGTFRNLTASPTANFTSMTLNNTNSSGVTFSTAGSLLNGSNTGTVSGTLTFTTGMISTGGNAFILGVSATATGTLAYTAGGFSSGSIFTRWWGSSEAGATITAGVTPTGTAAGVFPFVTGTPTSYESRSLYLSQTGTATSGGKISVAFTNVAGASTSAFSDGGYSVDYRPNSNWILSQTGITGAVTYNMAINGQNLYFASNGNSRITLAAAAASGSHQNGTVLPNAQRTGVPLVNLSNTYYLGINNADIPFVSISSGDWENAAIWSKGTVPTFSDAVTIDNGHTVTVSGTSGTASGLTVNGTGVLTVGGNTLSITNNVINTGTVNVNGGTLTVGPTGGGNKTFNNTGTLTVSSGTLNLNGNLIVAAASNFTQTGGNINVDGNAAGVALNSVASATNIVSITGSATTLTLSGGTLTIVDPHVSTDYALFATTTTATNVGTGHTIQFGNGTSTDAGGTNGFYVSVDGGSDFVLGNVTANTGTGTNRFVSSTGTVGILGSLTINTNSEYRLSSTTYVAGNLVNNGTLTATSTLQMASFAGATGAASTNAQSISGTGTFQNLTASATANLTSLTINNSNAGGVTLNLPLSLSGTLTLTEGVVNTTTTNLLTLGTATAAGSLGGTSATAYIKGPFARTFAANRTASGTYTTTTLFPVGKTAYLPIYLDPSTTIDGPVVFRAEAFSTNAGTEGAGVVVGTLSQNRWEALNTSGTANLTGVYMRLGAVSVTSTNKIVQATSATGAYGPITPATVYTAGAAGAPSFLTTSGSQILKADYSGYFSYSDLNLCTPPADQPTAFTVSLKRTTSFVGSFTAAASAPSHYLVVRYPASSATTSPVNYTSYSAGSSIGTGTVVAVLVSPTTSFTASSLTSNTAYDFYVYSYNNSGCYGPVYNATSPLMFAVTTCASTVGAPGTPAGSEYTTTGFKLTWTASSTAGAEYYLDVATNSSFTSFVTGYNDQHMGTSLEATLTGLTPGTVYYARVRAVNSDCWSNNSSTLTVYTLCSAVSSFNENFDAVSASVYPSCWTEGSSGTANLQSSDANTSPNTLYIYSSSTSSLAVVSMPPVNNIGAGTHRLRFNMRANSSVGGIIEVGYLTTPGDVTTFTTFQELTASTFTYQEYVVKPAAFATTAQILAFRHKGDPAYSVLIDDVKWEAVPVPIVTGFTSTVACGISTVLTINGSGFNGATSVQIGSTTITTSSITDAQITATISTALSGTISVTTSAGTGTSAGTFNFAIAPALTLSSTAGTICAGASTSAITVATGGSDYDTYVWSPLTNVSGNATSGWTFNPSTSTTYTVTATQSAGSCSKTATYTVTVNPVPSTIGIAPASQTICAGAVQTLVASGGLTNNSSTVNSGTLNLAIPDNSSTGASHTLNVNLPAGTIMIGAVVKFNITTVYAGDIEVNLEAPNGQIVNLVADEGSSGDNFTNTSVSSNTAEAAFSTGSAPYTGTFKAELSNSGLIGLPVVTTTTFSNLYSIINGGWKIRVYDDGTGDVASLVNWSITINYQEAQQISWSPTTQLFTDAAATLPYNGTDYLTTVYAKPNSTTTYTATALNGFNCTATQNVTITVDPATVSGSLNGDQSICTGTQPANLVLSGHTGSVVRWESASDAAFTTPVTIASTATTLTGGVIGNLTASTYFRAVVKSGVCNEANTAGILVTVSPTTVAGTVAGDQTICTGTQPADLVLSGNTGSVVKWQKSADAAFTSPTDIASTLTTLTGAVIGNLSATTYFRAVVQSGGCAAENTAPVLVTVNAATVAGTVTGDQAICTGSQPADLVLAGNTGSVVKWQSASDAAFTTPTDIASNATTLPGATIGALTATTYFRAVVKSGVCPTINTAAVLVTVSPATVAGTVTGAQTICTGTQPADLVLGGNTGAVVKWQKSSDAAFTTPTDIASNATTLTGAVIGSLSSNTYFRAVVQSGACAPANTAAVLISVDAASIGGSVAGAQTVCSGAQPSTDLVLSGHTGSVVKWQKSTDAAFTSPTDISSTLTTLTGAVIGNLSVSTYFRAVVKSGVCTEANSANVLITVNSSGGGTLTGDQTICAGTQPATDLVLTGNTGSVLKWQKSTDAGFTSPVDIASTATTLNGAAIGNLTVSTYFRAVVQSGSCASVNSNSILVTVTPLAVGGTVAGTQTVCTGSAPSTDLVLSGNVGTVVKWQKSTDAAFTSPVDIASTLTTLTGATIGNLSQNTYFRAVVQSGSCGTANSASVLVSVDAATVAGTVAGTQTICSGTQPGTDLVLSGNNGTVVKWQKSTDAAFTSPVDIASTLTTLSGATIGNLTATTYFRAVVKNGTCTEANSASVTVTVNQGPTITSSAAGTICSGTAQNYTITSATAGTTYTWSRAAVTGISNAAVSGQTANPITEVLTNTTASPVSVTYAITPSAAGCSGTVFNYVVTVNPASVGGTVAGTQTVCIGNTPGTSLVLSGNTGSVVKWQKAIDAAFTSPVDIASTSATLTGATIGSLTQTSWFRAVVDAGGCGPVNSAAGTITVNSTIDNTTSLAGTTGGAQVCASYDVSASNNYLNNCNAIASIVPGGASPVSGNISVCLQIDGTVQTASTSEPYVQRHYNVTPAVNPATATATMTLYFLQSEFDAFNTARGTYAPLPTNGSDATGKANLRITQFNGAGTTPGTYPAGSGSQINPSDASIVYNATANRWEVSFSVTGSGGFYVHTGNYVLPVTLTKFKGEQAGNTHKLSWTTATETNSKGFELQRSADGTSFSSLAYVGSKAPGGNSSNSIGYGYNDVNPLAGNNYYRLKQLDKDGNFSYSNVILLTRNIPAISISRLYPNPAMNQLNLEVISPKQEKVTILVTDLTGKVAMQQKTELSAGNNLPQLNVQSLAAGNYTIRIVCANGCESAALRFIKQ